MATRIFIPTALRPFAGGNDSVEVQAATVAEALERLVAAHPRLGTHLFSGEGRLRSFVNVYRNDEDIRYLEAAGTPLGASDTLTIVPSIAGG